MLLWQSWLTSFGQTAMFIYYSAIYVFYTMFHNAIGVPYAALMPDIVDSYNQSSNLSSLRTVFGICFCLVTMLVGAT